MKTNFEKVKAICDSGKMFWNRNKENAHIALFLIFFYSLCILMQILLTCGVVHGFSSKAYVCF